MKTILVTGSTGFFGSQVVDLLLKNNFNVIGLSTSGSTLSHSRYKHYEIDLTKRDDLDVILDFDIVIHLAGSVSAAKSIHSPLNFIHNNIIATVNVLDLFRVRECDGMIYASTAKIYPFKDNVTHTPYGATKLCADILAQEYRESYSLPISVLRFTSFYGPTPGVPLYPDQSWVNWFCYSNVLNVPITLYGDGMQYRDPLYIHDAANLLLKIIQSNDYNITADAGGGCQNITTPQSVVDIIQDITGNKFSEINYLNLRKDMKESFVSDNADLEALWKPSTPIRDGIISVLNDLAKKI